MGHHLYRHFDADGALLYIGESLSALIRLAQHRHAPWFDSIKRVEIATFDTREAARAAEKMAIRNERPQFNTIRSISEDLPYSPKDFATRGVKTISTEHHRALIELLIREREDAKLRQRDVAKRMRQYQSWVARIESGQRRIKVVEFFQLAHVIGFDAHKALRKIMLDK